jgi:hypothetical protein
MGFVSAGTLGTTVLPKTSGTTQALAITAAAEVGSVVWVASAWDNAGTAQADTNQLSIADDSGNTWTKLAERTYSAGAANDGVTVAMWVCKVTTQINSGANITVTSASARTAKITAAWKFTVESGALTFSGAGYFATASAGVVDPAAQTLSSLVNREYLFLHAVGSEGGTATTPSTNYNETWDVETTGGAIATNIALHGEYRVLTGTSSTVDVTSTTADRKHAQAYAAVWNSAVPTEYTDSGTSLLTLAASSAEVLGTTDSGLATLVIMTSATETREQLDAAQAVVVLVPATVDIASYIETATVGLALTASGVEESTVVDSAVAQVALVASGADVVEVVDAAQAALTFTPSATEEVGAGFTDAAQANFVFTLLALETLVTADAAQANFVFTLLALETVVTADAAQASLVFTASGTDSHLTQGTDVGQIDLLFTVDGTDVVERAAGDVATAFLFFTPGAVELIIYGDTAVVGLLLTTTGDDVYVVIAEDVGIVYLRLAPIAISVVALTLLSRMFKRWDIAEVWKETAIEHTLQRWDSPEVEKRWFSRGHQRW